MSTSTPKIAAAIFDLDGTLLDTLDDLADSMNQALAENGQPTHPQEAFRYFVGNGLMDLVRRTLPEDKRTDEVFLDQVTTSYRAAYASRWHNKSQAYPGVHAMLRRLQAKGFPMAVLSNKPQHFTELCIRHFFPDIHFHPLLGQRAEVARKPDPAAAFEIATSLGLTPAAIAFVGDTDTDMHTATNAGMQPIGVAWGFRPREELLETGALRVVETPEELESVLL